MNFSNYLLNYIYFENFEFNIILFGCSGTLFPVLRVIKEEPVRSLSIDKIFKIQFTILIMNVYLKYFDMIERKFYKKINL